MKLEPLEVDTMEGVILDLWVAKAEGLNVEIDEQVKTVMQQSGHQFARDFQPFVADWSFVGPILEREQIEVLYPTNIHGESNWACSDWRSDTVTSGKTALEAIKRCIIKRKYGDTIEAAA